MATIQQLVLIFLYQVVSHTCRNISDLTSADLVPNHVANIEHNFVPITDYLDDDEQKFEDIRNLLRVVPFQEVRKWNSNYSRELPAIRKHNAAPIAIILAPSNIAAKLQHKRNKNKQGSEHVDVSHINKIYAKEISENKHEHTSETNLDVASDKVNMIQVNNDSKEHNSTQNHSYDDNSEDKYLTNNNIFIDVEDQEYSNLVDDKNILHNDPEHHNNMIEKSLQFILEDVPLDPVDAEHNTQSSKEIVVESQSVVGDEMKKEKNKNLRRIGKEQNMLTNRRIQNLPNPLNKENKLDQKISSSIMKKESINSKHNISDEGKHIENRDMSTETISNNIQSEENVNDEVNVQNYNKDKIHLNSHIDGIKCKEATRRQNGTLNIYNLSFLFQK